MAPVAVAATGGLHEVVAMAALNLKDALVRLGSARTTAEQALLCEAGVQLDEYLCMSRKERGNA